MSSRWIPGIAAGLLLLVAAVGCSTDQDAVLAPAGDKLGGDDPRPAAGIVAGPFTFTREHGGPPQDLSLEFEVAGLDAWVDGFVLRLVTGERPHGAVTSAAISLNGETLFRQRDFNQHVRELSAPVALLEHNVLCVKLAGSPGSTCDIVIEGRPQDVAVHARALYPNLSQQGPATVPTCFTFGVEGWVGDDMDSPPDAYRILLIPALWEGQEIRTAADYLAHAEDLIDFDDPQWSPWYDYPAEPDDRRHTIPALDDGGYYLAAVQAKSGASVSEGRGYQVEVLHVQADGAAFRPEVMACDEVLGCTSGDRGYSVLPDQIVDFAWMASADAYNGTIAESRWGWDLVDIDDPNDPGWAVMPGLADENFTTGEWSFASGIHVLSVRIVDDCLHVTKLQVQLSVVAP